MRKITKSAKETQTLAKELANKIMSTWQVDMATVVALSGDLGAGKTTFTQGFAKALKIKEKITSPTFVLLKRFKIKELRIKNLIHIDAYRLEDPQEMLDLGWEELVHDPQNIIIIEWAGKIEKVLPRPYFLVNFKHKAELQRTIDISIVK